MYSFHKLILVHWKRKTKVFICITGMGRLWEKTLSSSSHMKHCRIAERYTIVFQQNQCQPNKWKGQTSHWCDSHTAHMPIQLLLPWINAVHTQSTKLSTQKNMSVTQNKQKTNVKAFQTEKERWLFFFLSKYNSSKPWHLYSEAPLPTVNSKHQQ